MDYAANRLPLMCGLDPGQEKCVLRVLGGQVTAVSPYARAASRNSRR